MLDQVRDAIGVIGGDCCVYISLNVTLEDATRFSLKVTTFFFGIEGFLLASKVVHASSKVALKVSFLE